MLDKIKYPFFTMQQLNLDWLMERFGRMPEIIQLPALAGDDISDVIDMVDLKTLEIPKTISFIRCGLPDDNLDRQCVALVFKVDNDNLIFFVMGFSANIGANVVMKIGGVWS